MKLIRGWERQYAAHETGRLRLSTGALFRKIGEEEGLGDAREGELRVNMPGSVTSLTQGPFSFPMNITIVPEEADEPEIVVKDLMPGERRVVQQSLPAEDSGLNDSPYLFCLSRQPETKRDWEALRAALPERYDTWRVTDDVDALQFEIEHGIKQWISLTGITEHWLVSFKGWVTYPYDTTSPAANLDDLDETKLLMRWLQKRKKYSAQQEYRLGWNIRSPQMETFPNRIEIELTRTGLGLFRPWSPPTK